MASLRMANWCTVNRANKEGHTMSAPCWVLCPSSMESVSDSLYWPHTIFDYLQKQNEKKKNEGKLTRKVNALLLVAGFPVAMPPASCPVLCYQASPWPRLLPPVQSCVTRLFHGHASCPTPCNEVLSAPHWRAAGSQVFFYNLFLSKRALFQLHFLILFFLFRL